MISAVKWDISCLAAVLNYFKKLLTTISEGDIVITISDISTSDTTEDDISGNDSRGDHMSKQNALTEPVYYILLSLLTPMHGYGIMQNVKKLTNDRVNIGAGTLYGAINTLLSKGFIAEYKSDPSKKEYIITDDGRSVLSAELTRLKELVKNGEELLEG